jgi:RNA polymerase sigma factor (sigma-70 family)
MSSTPDSPGKADFQFKLSAARDGCADTKYQFLKTYSDHLEPAVRADLGAQALGFKTTEDFVQQALATAVHRFDQFSGSTEGELRNWVRAILRNEMCADRRALGRQKRNSSRDMTLDAALSGSRAGDLVAPILSALEELIRQEDVARLREYLSNLAKRDRLVVYMRAVEELGFRAIGAALEMSEGAARQLYLRASTKLRQLLEDNGFSDDE